MSEVKPLRILVTGAAGQIAYSLLYSLAKGDVFGFDQPVSLVLLDIEPVMGVMAGVVMELQDCALPLLREVLPTSDLAVAFRDIDVAILIGSMPRREGMERKDLLKANVHIFKQQGEALSQYSKKTVKVLVVGNPANTNAFVCKLYAKNIPPENFTCLTRLDQNRAQAQVALRVGVKAANVENVIVWGNHSSTQFPDIRHSTVEIDGKKVSTVAAVGEDPVWIMYDFISTVQKRGAEVIAARKLSSALSAAKAISDHLRDWWFGTKPGQIVSMGVASDGSYGIDVGLIYSFPVTIKPDHSYSIVQGLQLDSFALGKLIATKVELLEERDEALKLCEA